MQRRKLLSAVAEDLFQIAGHGDGLPEALNEAAAPDRVLHRITRDCAPAAIRLECVLVPPELVGAAELLLYEAMGRIPHGDPCQPPDRDAVEPQTVLDQGALPFRSAARWGRDSEG